MTRFSTATMILAAAMMMAIVMVSLPETEAQTTCVSKLVPCFSFITTTTKPSKECCDSIKEAVQKELACLCTVYQTPGLLAQFNVTTAQALSISSRCDVTTDLSACPGAKSPSSSPKTSIPPPAGNTGKNTGAGNKLAGYGVTTVILSLVSSVFF